MTVDIDSDKESDFMEDLVRDFYKKSGRKGKRGKGILEERASSPSNDVPLARRLARKRSPPRCQEKILWPLNRDESGNENSDAQGQ